MPVKRRGLGRGLEALLGAVEAPENAVDDAEGMLRLLPIELVGRGKYQPREDIRQDTLQELAESIRAQGVVQPILVRAVGEGHYEIIAGERRWRAAQLAGLSQVPAVIRDVPDQAAIAIALIENIQREDLNSLEEAQAFKRLVDEFDMTHQQVADAVGRSRVAVTNLMRLLDLVAEVRHLVHERKLEMGHARALLGLSPPLQREAAQQVLIRGLSVRETEALVRRLNSLPGNGVRAGKGGVDPDVRLLQDNLSERLGAKVLVQHTASGKGRLVIHYNNLDELDGIIGHVK
jgi:ParB family chromosome partitioning protein